MPILGLQTTSALAANRANNTRRKVFYEYPNGKFPMLGLLSLAEDGESLTDYEIGWYEEQWKSARDLTSAAEASKGPFATGPATATAASNATHAAGDTVYLQLTSASDIRVQDVLKIQDVVLTSGDKTDVYGIVTALNTSTKVATLLLTDTGLLAATAWTNSASTANNSKYVTVVGLAAGEAERSLSNGRSTEPVKITNVTQIFRTVCGPWSGTALKMGQNWDSKPRYFKDVKDATIRHMVAIEKALLTGTKRETTKTNADGDNVPLRTAGGINWFLRQWDIGNTTNTGAFNYRPDGADLTTTDWTTTAGEEKRVIKNMGAITKSQWQELIRRMFTYQSDSGYEKLAIVGDKMMAVINDYVERNSLTMKDLNTKEDTYGMNIKKLSTPHGDLLFKTHPLFKEDPMFQQTMVVVDFGDISYHKMDGRDSQLLKNRQNNDADYRKDEILTECTFEIRRPCRHMWLEGITSILS